MSNVRELHQRRARRVRYNISQKRGDRLRLSVYRSAQHIYAQLIDDKIGHTVAVASSLESAVSEKFKNGGNVEVAQAVGTLIAERAKDKKVGSVVFDRGGYRYHGRVKALAEAARVAGLDC